MWDDVCWLRIEFVYVKEKVKMSGGRREVFKSIDVYADEESDEDVLLFDFDVCGESESLLLMEVVEMLCELFFVFCDVVIECRVIKK